MPQLDEIGGWIARRLPRAGRIVECGPAEQVLAAPGHEYTCELLAAVPRPGSVLTLEDFR